MNKIQKIEITNKAYNCGTHGIVPETVNSDCFYCESVGMSDK
jgi:hypothetical protein